MSSRVGISRLSYLYSFLSITFILLMLGILAMFLFQAKALSNHFKENVEVTVILDDSLSVKDALHFKEEVSSYPYVKRSEYISKEEAVEQFRQTQNNEDIEEILGYNPLFSSVSLFLNANYANEDSLKNIKKELLSRDFIQEIYYQEVLLDVINTNIQKISLILISLSLLLVIMAFSLIDNTIKLGMYSNRFLVKSMQLVGATRKFISEPFLKQSLLNGLICGLTASFLLALLLLFIHRSLPELTALYEVSTFVFVCCTIILVGILLLWWSTKMAVVKYLQKPLDELY